MGSFEEGGVSKASGMYNTLDGRLNNHGQGGLRSWFPFPPFRNSRYAPVQDADGNTDNGTTLEMELRIKDTTIRREAVLEALGGDETEFVFYRDENGKPGEEISEEELGELDLLTPAWTTMSHHATHCMYLLLQAAAALNLGTKAERAVHVWQHAGHCASVIMNLTKTAPG
ncbi:hypothetical protein INS49_005729 [Diaporthe citri]|uniref:uncharacterized protein n=1 Tax=Diaporthe citri TaxID=83186 RepID=UPI001C7F170A|nr:uncharacterized protein INS49_005729 [Diaporthe citri]KAG6364131.1 hypothetical protein INS49_005729 [Diaporthe citri]